MSEHNFTFLFKQKKHHTAPDIQIPHSIWLVTIQIPRSIWLVLIPNFLFQFDNQEL